MQVDADEVEVEATLKIPGRQDVPQVVRLPRKVAERMGLVFGDKEKNDGK